MESLASPADLVNRGIGISHPSVSAFLASASQSVRDAAGVPISRGTWTIQVPGHRERRLVLPIAPVVSVATVEIDGEPVTDWELVAGELWRACGWRDRSWAPSTVDVTVVAGYDPVPADVVDLVCSMVGYALNIAEDGEYASRGDVVASRVDDYSEQYSSAAEDRMAGPMELPARTRTWLRSRFSPHGAAGVVRAR